MELPQAGVLVLHVLAIETDEPVLVVKILNLRAQYHVHGAAKSRLLIEVAESQVFAIGIVLAEQTALIRTSLSPLAVARLQDFVAALVRAGGSLV